MYYKAVAGTNIVDAFDSASMVCVKYVHRSHMVLSCGLNDKPEGVVSSDGSGILHPEDWPNPIGIDYTDVILKEIAENEFKELRSILDDTTIEESPKEEPDEDDGTLEWAKKNKILLSKTKLADYLEQHPLQSDVHGGVASFYAVTSEKQNLMVSAYSTYSIKKAAGLPAVLTWNSTGSACEVWTEEEFLKLVLQVDAYVHPLVAAQQAYEVAINHCENISAVNAITINYDDVGDGR